jgi:hypothetical protein
MAFSFCVQARGLFWTFGPDVEALIVNAIRANGEADRETSDQELIQIAISQSGRSLRQIIILRSGNVLRRGGDQNDVPTISVPFTLGLLLHKSNTTWDLSSPMKPARGRPNSPHAWARDKQAVLATRRPRANHTALARAAGACAQAMSSAGVCARDILPVASRPPASATRASDR